MMEPILSEQQTPNSGGAFLWGALFGAVCAAALEFWAFRKLWQKSKDEGRSEERQKLEGEIAAQRREVELRRREADARRWELEESQSENQRLRWELRRAREKNG